MKEYVATVQIVCAHTYAPGDDSSRHGGDVVVSPGGGDGRQQPAVPIVPALAVRRRRSGGGPGPHLLEEHGRLGTLAAHSPQVDGALLQDTDAQYHISIG